MVALICVGLSGVARAGELRNVDDVQALCGLGPAARSPFVTAGEADAWSVGPGASTADQGRVHAARFAAAREDELRGDGGGPGAIEVLRDPLMAGLELRRYVERRATAVMQDYVIVLPTWSFHVLPHDSAAGLLRVALDERTALFGGLAGLQLWDQRELVFEVGDETWEQLEALRAMDGLSLRMRVQLVSRTMPERDYCSGADGVPVLEAFVTEAVLEDALGHTVYAQGVTRRAERDRSARGAGVEDAVATPVVRMTSVHARGLSSLTELEGAMLQLLSETDLNACYLRAVGENSALRGAMVVEFLLAGDGAIDEVGILIDAANSPLLARCALEVLDSARLPRAADAEPLVVRMNVSFLRDRGPGRTLRGGR